MKMSYEGYSQFLCKHGHHWTKDCNWTEAELKDNTCDQGHPAVWENMVDTTNGSFETNPKTGKEERIDGHIELEIESIKECKTCGTITEVRYKIPKKRKKR